MQLGHTGGVLVAVEVVLEGKLHPGELGRFPSCGTLVLFLLLTGPADNCDLSPSSCVTSTVAVLAGHGRSAEESMGETTSAAGGGGLRQPPQAGPLKAAAGSKCPICLGDVKKPAYVAYCMHQFCFRCIQQWARGRDDCPVCRQPVEEVLHSVRGDDDYEVYVAGLPARLRRRMAMNRPRRRAPQRRYNLRRWPTINPPAAGGCEPPGTESSQGQEAAAGPSNTPSQPAPAPSASQEPTPHGCP
ncbi:E3 ubiquitin-protein ligase Topors-like [Pipra filicauda]|uniref:E3 ubiquitin-protein ligase Topors n=1 Tax=Pipra filicauda TaxID=649802 RepID=A0A6J2FWE0_9PASS|nr:E3 ubiquitin-protein ligase Topors-like [Pipra filicauda]